MERPLAEQLRKRGEEHERRYVSKLREQGRTVEDLTRFRARRQPRCGRRPDARRHAPRADVIVQAPLGNDTWFGYADVLVKVPGDSALGDWRCKRTTPNSHARPAPAPSCSSASTPNCSAKCSAACRSASSSSLRQARTSTLRGSRCLLSAGQAQLLEHHSHTGPATIDLPRSSRTLRGVSLVEGV